MCQTVNCSCNWTATRRSSVGLQDAERWESRGHSGESMGVIVIMTRAAFVDSAISPLGPTIIGQLLLGLIGRSVIRRLQDNLTIRGFPLTII
jgi:hypothetical protein